MLNSAILLPLRFNCKILDKTDKENNIASGKQKLLDLGLTEEEVKALIGV